tara:strand:+ start:5652 stop:5801 length:150 start_codon:yes stop_codon:yes gene_type:complete
LKKIAKEANEARAQMNMYVLWPNGDSHISEEGFVSFSPISTPMGHEIRM